MSREPIFIATKSGKVVHRDALSAFATKSDSRAMPDDRFIASYTVDRLVEPLYNPEALARLLEVNTWHSRCVHTKAQDVAGLGWDLTPTSGDEEEGNQAEKEKILNLFETGIEGHPSIDDLFVAAWVDYEAVGYCTIEVAREGFKPDGEIVLLKQLAAHNIRVHSSGDKYAQIVGIKKRWFKRLGLDKDIDYETGELDEAGSMPEDRRGNELIFIKNYNPRSVYYGLPSVIPALGSVLGLQALRDYNLSFFETFGIPSYAIYITGDYDLGKKVDKNGKDEDDPEYDITTGQYAIIKQIEAQLDIVRQHPHAPFIFAIPEGEGGSGKMEVHFEPLAIEIKEASFKLYRKDNRDELLVAHGMPPYRIGIAETGSLGGNVAEDATDVYKDSVLTPSKNLFATIINKDILQSGLGVTSWEFWFEDLDTSDEKHDKEIADFLFARGAMTPNELIKYFGQRFGLEQVEGEPAMDNHYVNWTPIETEAEVTNEMMESVKSLHSRLVNIAIKEKAQDDAA
jgi:PBSX family phage portal protein